MTKAEIENKIATYTGGRAAEEIAFDEISTGASNDIEQATKIARAMITRYGMSDEFDMSDGNRPKPVFGRRCHPFLLDGYAKEIDRKVVEIVKTARESKTDFVGQPGKAGRAVPIPL